MSVKFCNGYVFYRGFVLLGIWFEVLNVIDIVVGELFSMWKGWMLVIVVYYNGSYFLNSRI